MNLVVDNFQVKHSDISEVRVIFVTVFRAIILFIAVVLARGVPMGAGVEVSGF